MRTLRSLEAVTEADRGTVAAIGNFDGVHLGHHAVIGEARRIAEAEVCRLAVVTFEPHPRVLFQADAPPFRLTLAAERERQVATLGADLLVEIPFDTGFAQVSAEDFVDNVLHRTLGLRHAVVGYDFTFGHRRRGSPDMLSERAAELGFGVTLVSAVAEEDGGIYSSTRVRQCLSEGDPKGAAALLGRDWEFEAEVETGDQRGRTIGFPTANLRLGDHLAPMHGVYAVRAAFAEDEGATASEWMAGVANYGRRPTVNDRGALFEIHLLDRSLDLYGRRLRVRLVDFIRPEMRFSGLDALKAQIAEDAATARRILGTD